YRYRQCGERPKPYLAVWFSEAWPARIQRRDERNATDDRGIKRPAGENHERLNHLYARCGAYPRWFLSPDQYRSPGWCARRTDVHLQDREVIHAGHRQCRESYASRSRAVATAGTEGFVALRSVTFCARV